MQKLFIILVSVIGVSFYQKNDNNKIYWTKDYQLKWEDFTGNIKVKSEGGAAAFTGIENHYDYKNGLLEIDGLSYFIRSKSWVKEDDKTLSTLKHEQGHFDITEIYSRKYRKALTESKIKKNNIKEKIEKLYIKITQELRDYQVLYDKETTSPRNETKQAEWDERIAKELEELAAYSEPHLSIKVK